MGRSGKHAKSTTERGLGYRHQKQREQLLAALVDGTPCPYADVDPKCPGPMHRDQDLTADHAIPRAAGGTLATRLAHAACDSRNGQRIATARKAEAKRRCDYHDACGSVHSRDW